MMELNFFRSKRKRFEELTLPVSNELFRLAFWRLGNRQDAEDVVQDTFLRAYRSFHTFQAGTNVKAWMTKILLNVVNDALKKKLRQVDGVTIEDEGDVLDSLQSQSSSLQDPEVQFTENEIDPELLEALQRLPTSLLHPLLLRELEDMTYEDISTMLSIPIGTVMSRLFRARRVVRERLTKPGATSVKQEVADDEVQ
jgi:RNA polymerase sigma-70 factor (ECF subfamily)